MFKNITTWIKSLPGLFRDSGREITKLQTLAVCGVLGALGIALRSVTIETEFFRIGFSTLPNRVVDFVFGPAVGGIFSALMDILKYIVNPTGAYVPLMTLTAALTGVIFGVILYKKKVTLWRVILAVVTNKVVVSLIFNTLILANLYGTTFMVVLIAQGRLLAQLAQLPADIILPYAVLKAVAVVKPSLDNIANKDRRKNKENIKDSEVKAKS